MAARSEHLPPASLLKAAAAAEGTAGKTAGTEQILESDPRAARRCKVFPDSSVRASAHLGEPDSKRLPPAFPAEMAAEEEIANSEHSQPLSRAALGELKAKVSRRDEAWLVKRQQEHPR
jgi:hypothetical protein